MQVRWQAFQLGWDLFEYLITPPTDMLFDPLLGSLLGRLRQLQLELDFTRVNSVKGLASPNAVQAITAVKGFVSNQLLAVADIPAMMAFSLGFDLRMAPVIHANVLAGLDEPVAEVCKKMEQELAPLDIDPDLLRPVLDHLADTSATHEAFAELVIKAGTDLAFPLANPHGRERIFIAMPFGEEHLPTLKTIRRAASYAGFFAWRVDDQSYDGTNISQLMMQGIDEAALVVADLTGNRPNVYFEAGAALNQGKKPVYIAAAGTAVHFDLAQYPTIFFSDQVDLESQLTEVLKKRVSKSASA